MLSWKICTIIQRYLTFNQARAMDFQKPGEGGFIATGIPAAWARYSGLFTSSPSWRLGLIDSVLFIPVSSSLGFHSLSAWSPCPLPNAQRDLDGNPSSRPRQFLDSHVRQTVARFLSRFDTAFHHYAQAWLVLGEVKEIQHLPDSDVSRAAANKLFAHPWSCFRPWLWAS